MTTEAYAQEHQDLQSLIAYVQDANDGDLPTHVVTLRNRLTSVLTSLRSQNKSTLSVMDSVNYAEGRIFERVIIHEDSYHLLPKHEPVGKMTWFVCQQKSIISLYRQRNIMKLYLENTNGYHMSEIIIDAFNIDWEFYS